MENPLYESRQFFINFELAPFFEGLASFYNLDALLDEVAEFHVPDHVGHWSRAPHLCGWRFKEEFVGDMESVWALAQDFKYSITAKHVGHNAEEGAEEIAIFRDGKPYATTFAEDGDLGAAVFEEMGSDEGEFTWVD